MLNLPSADSEECVIAYSLACARGHEFEGWFQSSAAYETQEARRELACPICGDAHIKKAVMAPSVMGSATKAKGRAGALPSGASQKQLQFVSGLRKFVEENAEYVGPRFPEEARKIHYGETDKRHIYGETTLSEAKELVEEGIDIAPLPPDPDSLN